MYREKIKNLEKVILEQNNEMAPYHLDYLQKTIDKTIDFVENTVKLQSRIDLMKSYCDKDIDLAIRELNLKQDIAFNVMEAMLNIINRICDYYSEEPFYDGFFSKESLMLYAFDFVAEYSKEEKD